MEDSDTVHVRVEAIVRAAFIVLAGPGDHVPNHAGG